MRSHYKPEDFRREKRRRDWWYLMPSAVVGMGIGLIGYMVNSSKPQPPIPAVSYETKRLLLDERRNVLLERLVEATEKLAEAKPVASTNALRTPLPGVAEQLGVSAATKRLVAELQPRGDSK